MKRTIVIPLVAGLFLVIVMGTGIALSIKNKDQLASNNTATSATDTSGSTPTPSPSTANDTTSPTPTPSPTASTSSYKDGSYSAEGSYSTPGVKQSIKVNLTVASGNVTAVTVIPEGTDSDSKFYEGKFASGIGAIVVGKPLSTSFSMSHVNGSSLTGTGFTQALEAIRSQAKA